MTAHAYGSLVRESGHKVFTPYGVKLQKQDLQDFQMNLEVFDETSAAFGRAPKPLAWRHGRRGWISQHALGAGGQFVLQALQQGRPSAELDDNKSGERGHMGDLAVADCVWTLTSLGSFASISLSRISAYLQAAEPLSLVAGDLCVDKFGEEELSEQGNLEDES